MKLSTFKTCTLICALLSGCASQAPKPVPSECVFPDAPKALAPEWVCDAPYPGVPISAVGSREKSAAGISFMKEQATTTARLELARQMKSHVSGAVRQFTEITGAGSSETVDRVQSSTNKLITAESISGSRIYASVFSPAGMIYVLVGLDQKLAEQQIANAVRTSLANDPAAWQQLRAGRSQEELVAEIARLGAQ